MPKIRRFLRWLIVAVVCTPLVLVAAFYGITLGFMLHGFGTLTESYDAFEENVSGSGIGHVAKYDNLLADVDYLNSVQEFLNHKKIGSYLCVRKLHGSEPEQVAALLILRSMLFANGSSFTYPFPNPSSFRDADGNVVPVVFNEELLDEIELFLQIKDPGPVLSKVASATRELIEDWEEAPNSSLLKPGLAGLGLAPPLGVGASPPKLLAEGWLNGTVPSEPKLEGKVVVVDVWAYW